MTRPHLNNHFRIRKGIGSGETKRIVILGAGFGGLRTALVLHKFLRRGGLLDRYEIVLVDRHAYHTYTPLLYEAAVATGEVTLKKLMGLVAYPLSELLKGKEIASVCDEVTHVDLPMRNIHLRRGIQPFDFLVLALGSEVNDFGIPGIREHGHSLKTLEDALMIRTMLLAETDERNAAPCRIAVGGGGATGVELASEIKNWLPKASVTLIEGSGGILPGLHEKVRAYAARRIARLGVIVRVDFRIKEVRKGEVRAADGRAEPFDFFFWTGGVKASALSDTLPFKKEKGGRARISEGLRCIPEGPDLQAVPHVYVLGDMACMYNPKTNEPVPLLASVAICEGAVAARNIFEEIMKDEGGRTRSTRIFRYEHKEANYVIPVGGKCAVGKVGPFIIAGFFGWVLKGLVEFRYLTSIMPLGRALGVWVRGLRLFVQNDNLG